MRLIIFIFVTTLCLELVVTAPKSLVLMTRTSPIPIDPGFSPNLKEFATKPKESPKEPIIYQFDINSNISNRYAKTLITSKVKNAEANAKEATFTVVLPEQAFISEFVMIIDEKSYKAYVKEKEEAKKIYDHAVQTGQSAGHVAVSARDSNRFTVSVNIEPGKKAAFLLTYEEHLERRNNQYELVLNIHPGQICKDMNIMAFVNESRPLKFVRTTSLRSGNEISKNDEQLEPNASIQIINSTSAIVKFNPDAEQQQKFAKGLGGKEDEGLAGQFVLQYDVERDPRGGEVLIQDGYFVHFFAPEELTPLPKHVVFVLDNSGSMMGTKLKQLKEAMYSILDELREIDTFHIVEFNTNVYVWNVETQTKVYAKIENQKEPFEELSRRKYPAAVQATKEGIEKGKEVIKKLSDDDLTNILSSLETALHLVNVDLKKGKKENKFRQPIIMFLTDGEPTIGISDSEEITKIITNINKNKHQIPIFCLSFGDGADKKFLRKLSLNNQGFSRHIYEGADAALQLQEFYKQISSPLLSNVNFKYNDQVKDVTKKVFPIYFRGCELVSAGRIDEGFDIKFIIEGTDLSGITTLPFVTETPVSSLERLWAYLTIKQKLEERELVENKTQLTKEALDLALKYSFVTEVSSLVVVKPNDTKTVETEDASKLNAIDRADYDLDYDTGAYQPVAMSGPRMFHMSAPHVLYKATYNPVEAEEDFNYLVSSTFKSISAQASSQFHPVSLRNNLPWLASVLHPNNTLTVKGELLELGEIDNFISTDVCTGTPFDSLGKGTCKLLKDCSHVFNLLSSFQIYENFACKLNHKYAGVCCPPEILL